MNMIQIRMNEWNNINIRKMPHSSLSLRLLRMGGGQIRPPFFGSFFRLEKKNFYI